MGSSIKIGVDAMGGDFGARPLVEGAVRAARRLKTRARITLVGNEAEIGTELDRLEAGRLISNVVHASERVAMSEDPLKAVRQKRESSLNLLAKMQAEGRIAAMISAGSTGAVVASNQLALGKLQGVLRPAIASFIPTVTGNSIVVDVGATPDCSSTNLLQFAIMGSLYANHVLRLPKPRVGLLSIGEEREKGNQLTRSAYQLLERSTLNFVGNLEGRDVLQGKADVVVCDGFVGNIVLKLTEGALAFFAAKVRREMIGSHMARFGAWLLKPTMLRLKLSLDPDEMGGAPLLGLKGVCIVAHGKSGPKALANAIEMAFRFVGSGLNERIRCEIAKISCWDDVLNGEVISCG